MVADCIAGKTAPLEAALAAALDEIAALKAQRNAPSAQIVNVMNPGVTRPHAANDPPRRGAKRPPRPADGVGQVGAGRRNAPIDASAVHFAGKGSTRQ